MKDLLEQIQAGHALTEPQMTQAMTLIMEGQVDHEMLKTFFAD